MRNGAIWCCLVLCGLLPSCALTEGRRQAADCSVRHARVIRTGCAAIAAAPEFAALAPLAKKMGEHASAIEEWGNVSAEDHGPPAESLELGSRNEGDGQSEYRGAARAKNAIMDLLPKLPLPSDAGAGGGLLTGILAALTGGGTLAGIAATMVRRRLRSVAAERDEYRGAADNMEGALDEIKHEAANGGLRKKRFGEILSGRRAARRHHARRKLDQVAGEP